MSSIKERMLKVLADAETKIAEVEEKSSQISNDAYSLRYDVSAIEEMSNEANTLTFDAKELLEAAVDLVDGLENMPAQANKYLVAVLHDAKAVHTGFEVKYGTATGWQSFYAAYVVGRCPGAYTVTEVMNAIDSVPQEASDWYDRVAVALDA